jgi:hypothetical protein
MRCTNRRSSRAAPDSRHAPKVEPLERRTFFNAAGWSDVIDNPLLPFVPGMTWVYKGTKSGAPELNRVVVQGYTKQIKGVTCTVVLDRVYEDGQLTENTHDYYAQDVNGNVWYFGEKSRDLENGRVVSKEGSWIAGVNGAKAGIIMQAAPAVGQSYFQEFAAGVAEDQAEILALHAKARTPFAAFKNCLETREFTALEPGASEVKYYAAGVGVVRQQTLAGEQESLKLVSFTGG